MPESNPSSYRALVEQRAALDAQIKEARKSELASVTSQVKLLVAEYGLQPEDIFGTGRTSKAAGKPVAPKYKDPATGATWTGRGKAPAWTKAVNLEDCRIAS